MVDVPTPTLPVTEIQQNTALAWPQNVLLVLKDGSAKMVMQHHVKITTMWSTVMLQVVQQHVLPVRRGMPVLMEEEPSVRPALILLADRSIVKAVLQGHIRTNLGRALAPAVPRATTVPPE